MGVRARLADASVRLPREDAGQAPGPGVGIVEPRTRSPLARDQYGEGFSPVTVLLPLFRRIALIGPRGSGRSTFLARLAREPATGLPSGAAAPTPVVLSLARTGELDERSALLLDRVDLVQRLTADCGNAALLLVDGLDDLAEGSRGLRRALDVVAMLTHRWCAARVVLAAARHNVADLHHLGFRVAFIEAMSGHEAVDVIRTWREHAQSESAREALGSLERCVYEGPLRAWTRNYESLDWLCDITAETCVVPANPLRLSELVVRRRMHDTGSHDREQLEDAAIAIAGVEPSHSPSLVSASAEACFCDPRLRGALAARAFARQLGEPTEISLTRASKLLPSILRTETDADYFAIALHEAELLWPVLAGLLSRCDAEGIGLTAAAQLACTATSLLRAADSLEWQLRSPWSGQAPALRGLLTRAATAAELSAAQRAAAADALAWWGDERHADPLASLVAVTGVAHCELAAQPVTVAQFGQFVRAGGYEDQTLWSPTGWAFRSSRAFMAPGSAKAQAKHPTRPIVHVCWYECEAYCRWLSRSRGAAVELAPVSVWNAAAYHPGGPYPWGAAEPSAELLNSDQLIGECTPVGIYPRGASRSGHMDLSGNVWEWCADDDGPHKVVAGGSWYSRPQWVRTDIKYRFDPRNRYHDLGFRIARWLDMDGHGHRASRVT